MASQPRGGSRTHPTGDRVDPRDDRRAAGSVGIAAIGPSVHTRELVVEEGGFVYDSDVYNDDLPYYVDVGAKKQLVIPYSMTYNDAKFSLPPSVGSPGDFLDNLKRGYDTLWGRGRDTSKNDVGRTASTPDRTSQPNSRAARVSGICAGERR